MPLDTEARRRNGRIGGLTSWAQTPDRSARTRNGRAASPADLRWHLDRLDPVKFANASEADKLLAADASKKVYFARLAERAAAAKAATKAAAITAVERAELVELIEDAGSLLEATATR